MNFLMKNYDLSRYSGRNYSIKLVAVSKNLILLATFMLALTVSAESIKATSVTSSETQHYETFSVFDIGVNTFCKLITNGDFDAVESMIKAGTDINEKSVGMTPLMYAARYNKVKIVKLLIAQGADLKIKSDRGYRALQYAEMSKAHDTYKIIKEALAAQKYNKKRKK